MHHCSLFAVDQKSFLSSCICRSFFFLQSASPSLFLSFFLSLSHETQVKASDAYGYSTIVKRPMDLSTIKRKIHDNLYGDVEDLSRDVILMFDNCLLYNTPETHYSKVRSRINCTPADEITDNALSPQI